MVRLFILKGITLVIELLVYVLLVLGDKVADLEYELERKLAEKLKG